MLIHVGDERSEAIDMAIAGLLSSIAGALNAVGFVIAGFFTANMTGNISAFADYLAKGSVALAFSFLGLVVAFIAGATCAALGVQAGLRYQLRSVFALAIVVEAMILAALAMAYHVWLAGGFEALLLIALSFVMGLQNAVTTMITRARVRTTHVSGMATDVGIELAAMVGCAQMRRAVLPKLKLHSWTLIAFAAGGVCGVVLFGVIGTWIFAAAAALLLAIALPEVLRAHRP